VLYWLGEIAFSKKDFTRATQQFQDSLAMAVEVNDLELVIQNHNALGRLDLTQGKGIEARKHFRAALRTSLPLGRPPLILDCMASIAELYSEESKFEYAALLATLTTTDPACRAMTKERGERLLARTEKDLSFDEMDTLRQRSRTSDLDTVAAQLLVDLETP
jgi:tetratricopeptide (TPR) repeat protein